METSLNKMVDIWQTIVWNAFSWKKNQVFNWQYASIGSGNLKAQNNRQAITWTIDDPIIELVYVRQ